MMRGVMKQIHDLPEKMLKSICEIDETYFKIDSKGVLPDTNGEDQIVPI